MTPWWLIASLAVVAISMGAWRYLWAGADRRDVISDSWLAQHRSDRHDSAG